MIDRKARLSTGVMHCIVKEEGYFDTAGSVVVNLAKIHIAKAGHSRRAAVDLGFGCTATKNCSHRVAAVEVVGYSAMVGAGVC